MAWLCAVLMVPLMLFIWALDTKKTRINRYRKYGWSWRKIAHIYKEVQEIQGLLITAVQVLPLFQWSHVHNALLLAKN